LSTTRSFLEQFSHEGTSADSVVLGVKRIGLVAILQQTPKSITGLANDQRLILADD
jgi:hypothetical protein